MIWKILAIDKPAIFINDTHSSAPIVFAHLPVQILTQKIAIGKAHNQANALKGRFKENP